MNIFEDVLKAMDENGTKYEIEENEKELSVYFNLSIFDQDVECVLEHEFENETVRFYLEFLEYEDEDDSYDAESFCNTFNYESTFLKAYVDERNVVCLEYYFIPKKEIILEMFDSLVGDIYANEDSLHLFID